MLAVLAADGICNPEEEESYKDWDGGRKGYHDDTFARERGCGEKESLERAHLGFCPINEAMEMV